MEYDVVVIGGGPAGLAASISSFENGARTLLIEREAHLGGILKQCIHDGFGLVRFKEKLSGPEYSERFITRFKELGIDCRTLTFVTSIEKTEDGFVIDIVSSAGVETIDCRKIILATGCRERTAKQVSIHGTRPFGVLTAGACQNLVNIHGVLPAKNVVILGSGDIGLIMARRLTLEGAKVLGVYEAKSTPSGLQRNIRQCLDDFNIPLYLSKTVTRVFGQERVEAVEISSVDSEMNPVKGTEEIVKCDSLIISVGLIPENELAEKLGVKLDKKAKGAMCDSSFETSVDGVYTCGNATHVNDLVDYVSESAEIAGINAALSCRQKVKRIPVEIAVEGKLLYIVPQILNVGTKRAVFYFRSSDIIRNATVSLEINGNIVFSKKYPALRPPEMERFETDLCGFDERSSIKLVLSEAEK